MRVPRVAFLSGGAHRALDPSAPKAAGGAELQVALLAGELAKRGGRPVLLAPEGAAPDGAEWGGVRIRAAGRFDTGGVADALRALPAVARAIGSERPDWAVVYGWTSWLWLLCLMRRALGVRVAFVCALDGEVDGTFRRENPLRGALFERGIRLADARFGITAGHVAAFRRAGLTAGLVRLLLQPGVAPGRAVTKTRDLLWVARCHAVKRPHLFLDLAERLPEASCRMVCSPQDRGLWESVKERAGLLPNVDFCAGVSYRDVQAEFDAARAFVNTSLDEGVPNTFIHSAAGGAAIASLLADPDGLIARFGAGVSAGGDFEGLARGVSRLLRKPEALAAAAAGAARFLAEWHDNTANVDAFLAGLAA